MPYPSRRYRRTAAVAATVALTLTGCAQDVPDRAGTLQGPSGDTNKDTGGADAGSAPDFGRAGRKLTKAEAKAALPGVQVLPAGWSVDPENTLTGPDEDEGDDTVTPARCEAVFDAMEDPSDEDPVADSGVTFTSGMLGPWLGVEVASHAEPLPDDHFAAGLDALSQCPKFTVDDGTSVARFQASALSFPNLGEESAALRLQAQSEGMTFALDLVSIRTGHNVVTVSHMSLGGAGSVKPLQKAARVTMTNLSK